MKTDRIAAIVIYFLCFLAILFFCLVAVNRFLYPYEVHWLEGSLLDQVARIQNGSPLYCQPSIHYVPWLYEPGYYYITAFITKITGLSFVTARIPSLLSTLGIVGLLYAITKKETSSTLLSTAAVGLYLAAYMKTENSMLHARVDSLFVFLLFASVAILYYKRSNTGVIIGALLLVSAYFTKQTAIVVTPAIILYFWKTNRWKQLLLFTGVTIGCIALGTLLLDYSYSGWFSYYTSTLPKLGKTKMLDWRYAITWFFLFGVYRCWSVTCISLWLPLKRILSSATQNDASLYFGLFAVTTAAMAFLGVLNQGGGHNVYLPLACGSAVSLPLTIGQIKKRQRSLGYGIICLQLIQLLTYPWSTSWASVTRQDIENQQHFYSYVLSLDGSVWIPFHGYSSRFTNQEQFADLNALRDVLLVGDSTSRKLEDEYRAFLNSKHVDHILCDVHAEFPGYYLADSMRNLNKPWISLITDTTGKQLNCPWMYHFVPEQRKQLLLTESNQ
ncbi:MAG TPA: glycosyltransferase family 39 protein [Candidatus Kapabacteria bacterium]|nr:glycosyltransferase family 39 protein [Candidatus Kapabacteria bacterium]